MKTALVTGASRGLGAEIAVQLGDMGYRVITPTRQELDLSNPDSIRSYHPPVNELDVLVNNAAILGTTLDEAMQVNAMGPYHLTRNLWPLLRARQGRVVNVSSQEGLLGERFGNRFYSVSKAALNAITRMMAANGEGIAVNACCPGWFRSRMGGDHALVSASQAASTPVWLATQASSELNGKFFINRFIVEW